MKWPFVSRARYENAVDKATEFVRSAADREFRLHALLDKKDQRYDDLLAKYHALKLQGASEPPPVPVAAQPAPLSPISKAIRDQIRANPDMPGLSSYLLKYAAELRVTERLTDEQIVKRLGQWESSEQWSAPVESVIADRAEAS